jgi:hypothetical protein
MRVLQICPKRQFRAELNTGSCRNPLNRGLFVLEHTARRQEYIWPGICRSVRSYVSNYPFDRWLLIGGFGRKIIQFLQPKSAHATVKNRMCVKLLHGKYKVEDLPSLTHLRIAPKLQQFAFEAFSDSAQTQLNLRHCFVTLITPHILNRIT